MGSACGAKAALSDPKIAATATFKSSPSSLKAVPRIFQNAGKRHLSLAWSTSRACVVAVMAVMDLTEDACKVTIGSYPSNCCKFFRATFAARLMSAAWPRGNSCSRRRDLNLHI